MSVSRLVSVVIPDMDGSQLTEPPAAMRAPPAPPEPGKAADNGLVDTPSAPTAFRRFPVPPAPQHPLPSLEHVFDTARPKRKATAPAEVDVSTAAIMESARDMRWPQKSDVLVTSEEMRLVFSQMQQQVRRNYL